jgi:hypothetical protein
MQQEIPKQPNGNGKEETKETAKLIARGKRKQKKPSYSNLGNQELANKYYVTIAN